MYIFATLILVTFKKIRWCTRISAVILMVLLRICGSSLAHDLTYENFCRLSVNEVKERHRYMDLGTSGKVTCWCVHIPRAMQLEPQIRSAKWSTKEICVGLKLLKRHSSVSLHISKIVNQDSNSLQSSASNYAMKFSFTYFPKLNLQFQRELNLLGHASSNQCLIWHDQLVISFLNWISINQFLVIGNRPNCIFKESGMVQRLRIDARDWQIRVGFPAP